MQPVEAVRPEDGGADPRWTQDQKGGKVQRAENRHGQQVEQHKSMDPDPRLGLGQGQPWTSTWGVTLCPLPNHVPVVRDDGPLQLHH